MAKIVPPRDQENCPSFKSFFMRAIQKCTFLLNLSHCVKSYTHFYKNLACFTMTTHQVWSSRVTRTPNFENFYCRRTRTNYENNGNEYLIIGAAVRSEYSMFTLDYWLGRKLCVESQQWFPRVEITFPPQVGICYILPYNQIIKMNNQISRTRMT